MRLYCTSRGIAREEADGSLSLVDVSTNDLAERLRVGPLSELESMPAVESLGPVDQVTVLAPVVTPPRVFIVGLNYRSHVDEVAEGMGIEPNYDIADPMVFVVPGSAVVGPDAQIVRPSEHPDQVDYEGEVAVVIGRSGRDVDPVDAWAHIAGVSAVNDVTARDVQLVAMIGDDPGIGDSKSYPTFKPLGPALLTADEIDPSFDLGLTTTVNGEVRQDARTTEFLTPIDELLAFISRTHGLEVGDVICTGSPRGVGMWSGPTWLVPGDVVEVAIEGVGTLRSTVS